MHVIVVGGGLAGLSTAARLAKNGISVAVYEKAPKLGGRAITIDMKGFAFNFGAHAIYARDRSILRTLEKELPIKIDWRDFDPKKARYDLGEEMTPLPATLDGLYKTKVLVGENKVKFALQVIKTVCRLENGIPGMTIGDWMKHSHIADQVKDLMLTLASSNFFTQEPEQIPSTTFFKYYQRLFTTQKAVAYIGGGWKAIVEEFVRVIEQHEGKIYPKEKVQRVYYDADTRKVTAIETASGMYEADAFVFCAPPRDLSGLFAETPLSPVIDYYAFQNSNFVLVYDIGLTERIASPYTYIYNKDKRIFVTDISHYDHTCVPEGGQLLQAVAYLKQEEVGDKEAAARYKRDIEEMYDKHFAGWREVLGASRTTERSVAQEIRCYNDQRPLPVKLHACQNAFFAGDWCEGNGQLSELSFSSGYDVATRILDIAKM